MDDPTYGQYSFILTCDFSNNTTDYVRVLFELAIKNLEGSNRATLLTNKAPTPLCAN